MFTYLICYLKFKIYRSTLDFVYIVACPMPNMIEISLIMLALCFMFSSPYYVKNYAGIIDLSLSARTSGPYPTSAYPDVYNTRFRVIPKNHQPDKWQLITDLSHPTGTNVNDGILPTLYSLSYVTIDNVILKILQYGKGTPAKINIQSVFCLLPVHLENHHLLTISWKVEAYTNHCIHFGLRLALK